MTLQLPATAGTGSPPCLGCQANFPFQAATENVLASLQDPNFRKVPLKPCKAALQQIHTVQQLLCPGSTASPAVVWTAVSQGSPCALCQHLGNGGPSHLLLFGVLVFSHWPTSLVQYLVVASSYVFHVLCPCSVTVISPFGRDID